MKSINISLEKNSYEIVIKQNIFEDVSEQINSVYDGKKLAVITDENVYSIYGVALDNFLKSGNYEVCFIVLPAGEKSKSLDTLSYIYSKLTEYKITRTDMLIAFGGGVVGDVAGFAAATYLRGIAYIQIPTTLLSQVDSSIGGKVAVNLSEGKNLVGNFYQPKKVIIDTNFLNTLPNRYLKDGMAEVIKYAVLFDSEFFCFLNTVNARENLEIIIEKCVSFKRDIVIEDEFEKGNRAVLNLGHTIGHAIEKCSDFNISHGSAVAVGMAMISKSAFLNGNSDKDITNEIIKILKKYNLPFSTEFKKSELYDIMLNDKKCDGDDITLILPKKIGECKMVKIKKENLINYL
ncbi:MAG: 3-dehydroquinate synthase [Oscillospiraceae bacterium]